MKFTKMHGIGNDYVYVNCFEESIKNPAEVSKFVSDRHFGIGSDGLILISPSAKADFRMNIYNADGSGWWYGIVGYFTSKTAYYHSATGRNLFFICQKWSDGSFTDLVGISDYRSHCMSGRVCIFKENQKK